MRKTNTIRIKLDLKNGANITEEGAVRQMNDAVKKLVKLGALKGRPEEFLRDYDVIRGPENYVLMDILADAYVDGAKLPDVGAGVVFRDKMPDGSSVKGTTKTFSQATIAERLKVARLDPKMQFRYIVIDYRRYFAQHKRDLLDKEGDMKKLILMFIMDTSNMLSKMAPEIKEGKQLATLLGVQTLSPSLGKVARDYSIAYKRLMASNAQSGTMPPALFKALKDRYNDFISEVLKSVFPNVDLAQYGVSLSGVADNAASNVSTEPEETQAEGRNYSSTVTAGKRTFTFL